MRVLFSKENAKPTSLLPWRPNTASRLQLGCRHLRQSCSDCSGNIHRSADCITLAAKRRDLRKNAVLSEREVAPFSQIKSFKVLPGGHSRRWRNDEGVRPVAFLKLVEKCCA